MRKDKRVLTIGAASCEITPEIGMPIQGATVSNLAESVRDPLEAGALYLRSEDGGAATELLLISCDIVGLEPAFVGPVRERIAEAAGVGPRSVLIGATHTHTGPSVLPTHYNKPIDAGYLERLSGWLVDLAQRAVRSAQPGRIASGQGAARVGYNRRCCWADGTRTMGGNVNRADFVGLEGPDDPTHTALAAADMDGKILALLHANTAHPVTFYGRRFYSADYPGAARKLLRDALGPIPVLYFNGALGDINPTDLMAPAPSGEAAERCLARVAHCLAGQTLRLLYHAPWRERVALGHAFEDLQVRVRLPEEKVLADARQTLDRARAGQPRPAMDVALAHGADLLHERFAEAPIDRLPIHAVRIGQLALLAQPCELYCRFGCDIRRRSPAPRTAILGLTDGYHGYCPTPAAIRGGGYSAQPIYWARLAEDAGDRIVDASARLLHRLWASSFDD